MILDGCAIERFVDLVREKQKPGMSVAEIGVWQGETSIKWLPIVKENNGSAYLVDWFNGCEGFSGARHGYYPDKKIKIFNNLLYNLEETKLKDFPKILDGISWEMAKFIPDKSLDICFIDASHIYKDVLKDIQTYLPKVKDGGIICGHDCQNIYEAGGPGSFSKEELLCQHISKFGKTFHVGVMQAVYDSFKDDVLTNIPDPLGQQMPMWIKQL